MQEIPLLVLKGLEGNPEAQLTALQDFLLAHIDLLRCVWAAVLVATLITVLTIAVREHVRGTQQ